MVSVNPSATCTRGHHATQVKASKTILGRLPRCTRQFLSIPQTRKRMRRNENIGLPRFFGNAHHDRLPAVYGIFRRWESAVHMHPYLAVMKLKTIAISPELQSR